MEQLNNTTQEYESQVQKILKKMLIKRAENKNIISFLKSYNQKMSALSIENCGTNVGITNVEGIARIVQANFCRQRVCAICAWRRQAKFLTQMNPVLQEISARGYEYIFCTLTIRNMPYTKLENAITELLKGYDRLLKRRKIKKAWSGAMRSLELTYNAQTNTFHPHIHMLIAVKQDYFNDKNLYISHEELTEIWKECLQINYNPQVDMRKVDNTEKATVETFKYALKPSQHTEAIKAFYFLLKGRRLISFSGIFAKVRKALLCDDFENILIDDIKGKSKKMTYTLYKFDVTGGVYKFYNTYTL